MIQLVHTVHSIVGHFTSASGVANLNPVLYFSLFFFPSFFFFNNYYIYLLNYCVAGIIIIKKMEKKKQIRIQLKYQL